MSLTKFVLADCVRMSFITFRAFALNQEVGISVALLKGTEGEELQKVPKNVPGKVRPTT